MVLILGQNTNLCLKEMAVKFVRYRVAIEQSERCDNEGL
jgi:hypothetical protein